MEDTTKNQISIYPRTMNILICNLLLKKYTRTSQLLVRILFQVNQRFSFIQAGSHALMNDFKSSSFGEIITKSCIFESNNFLWRQFSDVDILLNTFKKIIISFLTVPLDEMNYGVRYIKLFKIHRTSHLQVFCKIVFFKKKNAKFTEMHLSRRLLYNKFASKLWQNFMSNFSYRKVTDDCF